jgi:DNA-binding transcriptional ArsR family regulator
MLGETVFITPCDTRMRIIGTLAESEMTGEDLARETKVAYSTVMDHMDVLEQLGIVGTLLKRERGRRRIFFKLAEDPLEKIEELFAENKSAP